LRVSLSQEFHAGDAVRLMIESNISGYLYVFHTENDGAAKMLFPDARLQGGGNSIRAHVPYEVPARKEEDPKFRWLYFNDKVAIERFYLLVTREPLTDVPTGKTLEAHCSGNPKDCPWRPSAAQWKQLLADAKTVAHESLSRVSARFQTAAERKRDVS